MSCYVAIIPGHGSRSQGWDPGAVGTRTTDTGPERLEEAALVRQIAERHGGRARCEPRDGGGSRFVISLPAAPPSTA